MAWSGLGVNYNRTTGVATDIAYFQGVGVRNIRVNLPDDDDLSARSTWRAIALQFKNAGFYVIFGLSAGNTLTSSNWSDYRTNVLAEAALCQAQGVCDEFQIGNELEYQNDDTTLTDSQLRSNLRSLATDVQGVFTAGPISYATERGSIPLGDTNGSDLWAQEGKGDLDLIGINCYGWLQCQTGAYKGMNSQGWTLFIPNMIAAFGSSFYLSEFGLDSYAEYISVTPDFQQTTHMRQYYGYIRQNITTKAYVYAWGNGVTNDFAMKFVNGDTSNAWDVLLQDNKRQLNIT